MEDFYCFDKSQIEIVQKFIIDHIITKIHLFYVEQFTFNHNKKDLKYKLFCYLPLLLNSTIGYQIQTY